MINIICFMIVVMLFYSLFFNFLRNLNIIEVFFKQNYLLFMLIIFLVLISNNQLDFA